jgi:ribose transport system permease protein
MFRFNRESVARFQSLLALVLLVVGLSLAADNFLTVENGLNVLRQISINLCLSIGMTLVILSGGIDLSVGSVLALSGAVAAGLLKDGVSLTFLNALASKWFGTTFGWLDVRLEFTPFGAIVAGIAVGLVAGWINGYVITRFRVPPFVATLGMLSIARGLTRLWTRGFPITNLGENFGFMGTGYFLNVPMPVWISAALAVAFMVMTRRTRFGRYLYAIGGNERAAVLSGINVVRVKRLVYTLGGGLAGVAGLLLTARLNAADPKVGVGYELDSIAAVVIGGTSLSGGRGSIPGTVLGCLLIGVLNNGLVLLGVSDDWQLVIKGLVIIIAVAIDQAGRRND